MKKVVLVISLLASLISSASYASRESRDGAVRANAQFKAVTQYALEHTLDTYRILQIAKINDTDFFVISYGSLDTSTGRENVVYRQKVEARIKSCDDGTLPPPPPESTIIEIQ